MNKQTIRPILDKFIDQREKKEGFPVGYCNPCVRALHKILLEEGFYVEQKFTYEGKGDGHTFLITKEGIIIDPTYGQYDNCFLRGFIGEQFPNKSLQQNILGGKEFMELQKIRLNEGVYEFMESK